MPVAVAPVLFSERSTAMPGRTDGFALAVAAVLAGMEEPSAETTLQTG